jgi:hypothetical protein
MSWLRAQLDKLDTLTGAERVVLADRLAKLAGPILTAEGDRGVFEALHRGSGRRGPEVAQALGTTVGTLHNRSSRHMARLRGDDQHV